MPKTKIRALAEAKILQFICYDSKGQKRAGVAYICGTDAFWGKDIFSLFNRDQAQVAPQWLREQLQKPATDTIILDFTGAIVSGSAPLEEPTRGRTSQQERPSVSDAPLGDAESAIPQG